MVLTVNNNSSAAYSKWHLTYEANEFFNVILNSCSSNDNTFIITTVYMHQLDEALFAEIAEIICKKVFPIIFTKIKGTSKQDEHIHTNTHTHTHTPTHTHTHRHHPRLAPDWPWAHKPLAHGLKDHRRWAQGSRRWAQTQGPGPRAHGP